ncbi:unnamed protein product [Paramecium octaurelia]|uniref:Uncharacterized protein n=1 Tax=Paramecium octaurelia TaxID=43137 RepID=A0A8S1T6Z7_PAROT|nr:unnamed protein product [Paramecium octaurelia]
MQRKRIFINIKQIVVQSQSERKRIKVEPKEEQEKRERKENKEPEKGCCDKYAECLVVTGKAVYSCSWLLVPVQENAWRLFGTHAKKDIAGLDNCHKHYNQWKDEGFTDV